MDGIINRRKGNSEQPANELQEDYKNGCIFRMFQTFMTVDKYNQLMGNTTLP